MGQIQKAQKARNLFAHNGLHFDVEKRKVRMTVASARGKLKLEVRDIELMDVRRASMQTHEATLALYNLVLKQSHKPRWRKPANG
jgi:hypothetical protein